MNLLIFLDLTYNLGKNLKFHSLQGQNFKIFLIFTYNYGKVFLILPITPGGHMYTWSPLGVPPLENLVQYCWRYCNPDFEKWKNTKSVLVPMLRQKKLTDYSTASRIQLNHSFSVNHYFSFRIKQELPIVYIVISLFVSVLFHFMLILLKLENEKCTRSYAEAEKTHGLFHSILYPTKSFIFCKSLLFFQNKARIANSLYSYKFICVCIISFYANITKIGKRKVYSFLC